MNRQDVLNLYEALNIELRNWEQAATPMKMALEALQKRMEYRAHVLHNLNLFINQLDDEIQNGGQVEGWELPAESKPREVPNVDHYLPD